MRRTAFGLATVAVWTLAACGGSSNDDSAMLDEPETSRTVAAAALQAAAGLVELAADAVAVRDLSAADQCESGSVTGVCVERRGESVQRLELRRCRLPLDDGGAHVTVDGRFALTTPFSICGLGGLIPPEALRTYRFDGFTAVVEDGAGVVETFAADHLVETVQPLRTGCAAADASIDVDGALTVSRRGGADLALRASQLHVERRGARAGPGCNQELTASGGITVIDRDSDATTRAKLDGFAVATDAAGRVLRVDGGFALSCALPLTIATNQVLEPGEECPRVGMLELERRDGSRGFVRFRDGAVEVDADGDGSLDATGDCDAADCGS